MILNTFGNFTNAIRDDIESKICKENNKDYESLELLALILESRATLLVS